MTNWRTARLVVPVLGALVLSGGLAIGQEKADEAKPAAKSAAKKEFKGRLPAYFAAVVSSEQRAQVYEIQAKYNPQLEALEKEIAALKALRDKEVDAVLSPEQLAAVNKKREEAKQRRTSKKAASSGSGS